MYSRRISSMSQSQHLVSLWSLGVFITWTVTSFLCHHFAKDFLGRVAPTSDGGVTFSVSNLRHGALAATGLTAVQIALCHILVDPGIPKAGGSLLVARVCHVTATWFTNLSMACMFASSTFAIKLMEPITSAIVQYAVLGTPLSPMAGLSLPVIVGGAIAFSGNPLSQSNLTFGIAAAFISNIILAVRNVALKVNKSSGETSATMQWRPHAVIIVSLITLGFCMLIGALFAGQVSTMTAYVTAGVVLSGMFHVVYSFVSTGIVLAHLSVVSHAVTNILKRVLVVLLLYVTGTRSASLTNFLGLAVCTLGLFIYAWSKRDTQAQSTANQKDKFPVQMVGWLSNRARYVLVITCLIIGCLGFTAVSIPAGSIPDLRQLTIEHSARGVSQMQNAQFPSTVNDARVQQLSPYNHVAAPMGMDRTFNQRAHEKPRPEELLPDLEGYLAEDKAHITQFFAQDYISDPPKASYLSKKLRTNTEIINEAQRLHFEILETYLKGYKYAMLLDIAAFENKGDPAITVGEIYFLARMKLEIIYYNSAHTFNDLNVAKAATMAKRYSPKDLVILIHGGGNIVGYPMLDYHRFKTFKLFKNYPMFVFPQSIYIPDNKEKHLEICAKAYCCNENVTFVLRDEQSYGYALKYFGGGKTRFLMAPDMAFQIGPVKRFIAPPFDIMWIKRQDNETPGYTSIADPPKGIRVHVSDWLHWNTPKAPNSLERAHYICANGFFFLQRGRVLITDRLHGHILATLMDIPHVLIDNKQHKLSAYHRSWTAGLENTVITDDPAKAMGLALELLRKYNDTLPPRLPFLHIDENKVDIKEFTKVDSSYP